MILNKPASRVLLVEDNSDDVELTREGFRRTSFKVELNHVPDGAKCMDYLRKQGQYANVSTPDLVLLDLNMPVMDGREVLAELARDDKLKQVPVIVLTTSSSKVDLMISYRLGCNSYVVKPVDFADFQRILNSICDFWFGTAVLPDT
jgi:two-component system, chemotaxis family, response regulator Rcp1